MLILPLMPHRVAQKSNFVHDFANNAGLRSKKYQASRGLSSISELLVKLTYHCKFDNLSLYSTRLTLSLRLKSTRARPLAIVGC